MVFGVITLFAVGALCVVLGIIIWKQQKIDLIHDYQHRNVRAEDKPAYCRQMGISIIFIGVAIGLDGAANLFSSETFGYLTLAVGFASFSASIFHVIVRSSCVLVSAHRYKSMGLTLAV